MKSIAFFNNKGGVGKTTLLCNLASYFALKHSQKILIIDLDPQCNSSAYVMPEEELTEILIQGKHNSIEGFFEPIRKGKGYPEDLPTIFSSRRFSVDIIIGDPKLSLREDLLSTDWAETKNGEPRGFQTTFSIRELLSRLGMYDLVLIDVGPSLGALNRAVLLAVDYFLMPLSVDIFSLMAIANIQKSVENWKSELGDAIANHKKKEGSDFEISGIPVAWNLKFLGYVTQQYRSKMVKGVKEPVVAFDKIIKEQKKELDEICDSFGRERGSANLGEVPILSSIIPMSQSAHAPVFALEARDGVVGSGYYRVAEAATIFDTISKKILEALK